MRTEIINIQNDYSVAIDKALKLLVNGNVIAVPTETVYGLVCNYDDDSAINKIYELKGRDYSKPLAVFCSNIEQVKLVTTQLPQIFFNIYDELLPGPITLILRKKDGISDLLTAGKNTIGIRIPDNNFVLELIEKFGKPLASTSANISNNKSAINAKQVQRAFNGKIPLIIDGNNAKFGIESTILDISSSEIKILREGFLKKEFIDNFFG